MRGHVIITLADVTKDRVTIGDQPVEKTFQIAPDFGIGILLNQKRSGGVLEMKGGEPRFVLCARNMVETSSVNS